MSPELEVGKLYRITPKPKTHIGKVIEVRGRYALVYVKEPIMTLAGYSNRVDFDREHYYFELIEKKEEKVKAE